MEDDWPSPDTWSTEAIEEAATSLTSRIRKALHLTTPLVKIPDKPNPNKWWTDELRQLRRAARVAHHANQNHPSTSNHDKYQEALKSFKKALKKAKTKSWEDFTSSCDSVSTTAKLTRAILKKRPPPLGLTTRPNGSRTTNGLESLQNLMSVHFPESNPDPPQDAPRTPPKAPTQLITIFEVVTALNSFHSQKAAGPDDIPPIALKNLPLQVISFITDLFNGCLQLNFILSIWCESKAIFLKKAGNRPLHEPKSYRPICLASFLFKALEKVLKDKLEQQNVYPQKISDRQHGFVPNKVL